MVFVLLFVAVICGFIGYAIGNGRGRGTAGFWLGLLLGPIGVLAALFLPKE
jgi:uncharacterized membrane protein YeaQ/YmgE (transglycosylase-associated protein family)